ncbi:MAG: hypothetical protein HYY44_01615 [Deltaproteobacteria bacterium]|nr:hypothetical protein [Deltaproteobacteria bacterium]
MMLSLSLIKKLFHALNDELREKSVKGEIGICGGAVMCLVFQARKSTKDVDGIFEPTREIRKASEKVARKFGVPPNWLNDAAKAYFHTDPPKEPVMELSHLRVWAPRADYMLAMKSVSARFDTHDKEDVEFLIHYLGIKKPKEVFGIISKYYPDNQIPPKTKFFIEELMDR